MGCKHRSSAAGGIALYSGSSTWSTSIASEELAKIAVVNSGDGILVRWINDASNVEWGLQDVALSSQLSGTSSTNTTGGITISSSLTVTAITGQTEGTTITGTDEFLYSDGGVIKRVDFNRFIVGQAFSLTSGLVSTDEFLISDGGTVKKMDVSVLETYLDANLSYADLQLSNLTGTSAIDISLIPTTTNDVDLGSSSLKWRDVYIWDDLELSLYSIIDFNNSTTTNITNTSDGLLGITANTTISGYLQMTGYLKARDHSTTFEVDEVVNTMYGTAATPAATAASVKEGTVYIQYS